MATGNILKSLLIFLFTLLCFSCSEVQEKKQSEYDLANHHINEGRYNAAIQVMQGRLREDPQDQKARLILASAYAARAGVLVRDYYDIASSFLEQKRAADQLLANQQFNLFVRLIKANPQSPHLELLKAFDKIYRASFALSQILATIDLIPSVSGHQLKDLQSAIETLGGSTRLSAGPSLYRALLRIVYLKNVMSQKYDLTYLKDCEIDLLKLILQVEELKIDLRDIISDLAHGSTKKSFHADLLRYQSEAVSSLDDALNFLLTIQSIQELETSSLSRELARSCER